APRTSRSSTRLASASPEYGTTARRTPSRRAVNNAGNNPGTERSRPSKASSPKNSVPGKRCAGTCSAPANTAQARAKSYDVPVFGNDAGDSANVTQLAGQ